MDGITDLEEQETMSSKGFIYIAANRSMPGLVKIGRSRNHPDSRMQELATTGVPTPFECLYVALVSAHEEVELRLHAIFATHRVSQNREFFKLEVPDLMDKIRDVCEPMYEELSDALTVSSPDSGVIPAENFSTKIKEAPLGVQATIERAARNARNEITVMTNRAKKRFE